MLSELLAAQTQCLRTKLKDNLFLQKLLQGTLTHHDYAILLRLLFTLHHTIEAQIIEHEALDMLKRGRASKALSDLIELGYDECLILQSSQCDLEIKIDTPSKAYGALYVLESSRIEGLFWGRLVQKNLGTGVPVRYFMGEKERTSAYFRHFKALLNEKSSILNITECVQAAKDVFLFVDYLFQNAKHCIQEYTDTDVNKDFLR